MKLIVAEQNYWPGYLDALINVLLNLLMLVAVFAMGLVSLNLQVFKQEQQMSQLGAQWAQVVREMVGDGSPDSAEPEGGGNKEDERASASARQSLSARLNALNVQEILVRREELAQKTQLMLKAREDERQQQAQAQLAQVAALLASQEKLLEEKQKKMAEEEARLKGLQEKIKQERQQIVQLQARASPVQGEPVLALRIPGRADGTPPRDSGATAPQPLDTPYQLAWEYLPDQFSWASASRPKGYAEANKAKKWVLKIFADMDNPRNLREAFARANSIREVMVRDGYVRESIKLEIKPAQALSSSPEMVYRTVFLLPQQ